YANIKAQIYTNTGAKVGGEFLVNTTVADTQVLSSITALANGYFVAAWEDQSFPNGQFSDDIKAQVFDSNGQKLGSEFLVNTTTASTQRLPAIAGLADGSFVASWTDLSGIGGDTSGSGIKAQVFSLVSTQQDTAMALSVAAALTDTDGSETLALAVS